MVHEARVANPLAPREDHPPDEEKPPLTQRARRFDIPPALPASGFCGLGWNKAGAPRSAADAAGSAPTPSCPTAYFHDVSNRRVTKNELTVRVCANEGLTIHRLSPPAGSNVYNAFKMYRNYDGAHSKFGDISVSASGPNPDTVATFAALRSSDGALTVMVVAKYLADSTRSP
jgi:hypothetical protein